MMNIPLMHVDGSMNIHVDGSMNIRVDGSFMHVYLWFPDAQPFTLLEVFSGCLTNIMSDSQYNAALGGCAGEAIFRSVS